MSIAIVCSNKDPQPWFEALKAVDNSLDIQIWPPANKAEAEKVQLALCWR